MSPLNPYTIQRFRGGYAIVWYEGDKRHRRQLDATDRASAESEARQLWQQADDAPWTVGRIIEGYIANLAKENPPSLQRRKDAWKAMQTFWADVDPATIDQDMCRDYREERPVADATARYELLMLSTALNWAVDAHHMARPSAILELEWQQVDFERRQIKLNPPGRQQTAKKRPVVTINDELYEALVIAYNARQGSAIIERGAEPIQSIKKAFQAASKRSGVKATPYTLRHTGAVWAAEGGVSMPELAQFMGHDDDRTTQKHYARFSPDFLKGVGEKVAQRRKAG